MKVMVSAAGSPASVSIVKHLRALGHHVVGINAGIETESLGREFCDEFHLAPFANAPEFLPFLVERLREVDIFLPFVDEELLEIAGGWKDIPAQLSDRIALSQPEVLIDCVDKCRFQNACVAAGLPIAPLADAAPAFFKPRIGRGGKGVIEARDAQMFAALNGRDGVIQRAIDGVESTVDAIFDRDGVLVSTSARKRVRASGVSTIGEVCFDPALHELGERIGRHWRFKFAINFQSIRDGEGRDWIIELNPRLAGSAIFSALAGCDPFAGTLAIFQGLPWRARPDKVRVWRYWDEIVQRAS